MRKTSNPSSSHGLRLFEALVKLSRHVLNSNYMVKYNPLIKGTVGLKIKV
jgi:hypothetical protein